MPEGRAARCGDCGLPYDEPSDDGCPRHPWALEEMDVLYPSLPEPAVKETS